MCNIELDSRRAMCLGLANSPRSICAFGGGSRIVALPWRCDRQVSWRQSNLIEIASKGLVVFMSSKGRFNMFLKGFQTRPSNHIKPHQSPLIFPVGQSISTYTGDNASLARIYEEIAIMRERLPVILRMICWIFGTAQLTQWTESSISYLMYYMNIIHIIFK